jgi:hypothetical protein
MAPRLRIKLMLVGIVCALALVGLAWLMHADPPLRRGMGRPAVRRILGEPQATGGTGVLSGPAYFDGPLADSVDYFDPDPDFCGNRDSIQVFYLNGEVVGWRIQPRDRSTPPWLDKAAKWVGW